MMEFGRIMFLIFRRTLLNFVASLLILCAMGEVAASQERVTVFAAASLKNALDAASSAWTEKTRKATAISYASSSALAKQIEAGAPADVFLSADLDWMDYLDERQLLVSGSYVKLLSSRLVLIGPKGASAIEILPGFDLPGLLGEGKLAMGAADSVPAGKYGKAALQALGIWGGVKDRIVGAENVRAALQYVSRGETPYGIVYETDARAEPDVTIVGIFPENTHPPIVYPVALLQGAANPTAEDYVSFLTSQEARRYFEAEGFEVLGEQN
jgi:molybdate transport system substrate-binding protein